MKKLLAVCGVGLILIALMFARWRGWIDGQTSPKPGLWESTTHTKETASPALTELMKSEGKEIGPPSTYTRRVCMDEAQWEGMKKKILEVPKICVATRVSTDSKSESVTFKCQGDSVLTTVESTLYWTGGQAISLSFTSRTTYPQGMGDIVFNSSTDSRFISDDCGSLAQSGNK